MVSAAMRGGTRGKARLRLAQHMQRGHSRRDCSSGARHTCARQRLGVPFKAVDNRSEMPLPSDGGALPTFACIACFTL